MKRLIGLISALIILLGLFPMKTRAVELDVGGKSALLMDVATGQVLYEKNAHEPLPPASVTKVMTLLLVCEAIDRGEIKPSDPVTASAHAASMGGSQIFLKEGEQMTARDLIKSVVIASANDAAVANVVNAGVTVGDRDVLKGSAVRIGGDTAGGGVFAIGAVVGILGFSKFLHWLLARWHRTTLIVLAGFIIGSLVKVWPWSNVEAMEQVSRCGGYLWGWALLFAVIGFSLVTIIEIVGRQRK